MPRDRLTRKALEVGRREAREVLKLRATALKRRAAAIQRSRAARRRSAPAGVDDALRRAVGDPATAGTLVAEGDSWFDYPLNDVLSLLEDDHGYDVESVAHKGDRVEEMAYGRGQLEELTRRLEKLLRRGVIPKAILLSGGGNDVAGDEFGMLLNHARSPVPGLNDQVVAGVVDERVRFAYVTVLSAVTEVCQARIGRPLPILVHGYDYPVPDGRGFLGGWWFLPGPWLEPGFREKGFEDLPERIALVGQLIDRFNTMVQGVATLAELPHVTYVNLRGTLSVGADYETWWANELHPTRRGFEAVTGRFAAALAALP
jgi:hypothetical protein